MAIPVGKLIAIVLLPIVVFVAGVWLMSAVTGPRRVSNQRPLNRRLLGYDTQAVHDYWNALGAGGRGAERRAVQLDLVFPLFYGGALATSLWLTSAMLGGSFPVAWLIAPVVITVVADWIENLVQLNQLASYTRKDEKRLAPGWIRIASTATIVKLLFLGLSCLVLLGLLLAVILGTRAA